MILGFQAASPFVFVLSALAAWRLTTLLCYDRGPFDVLTAARRLFYRLGLKTLVDCFHCTAVWVSAVVVLAVFTPTRTGVLLVIALAGAVSLLQKGTERIEVETEA